jgi:hypothetical protein
MKGTAQIFVSIKMKWKDPRLAWEMNEENCADYINVYTGYDQGTYSKMLLLLLLLLYGTKTKQITKKQYRYQKNSIFFSL